MNKNDHIVKIVEKFESLIERPKNVELWTQNQIQKLLKQGDKEFIKNTLTIMLALHEEDDINLFNKEFDFTRISEQEKHKLTKILDKEFFSELQLSKEVDIKKLTIEERNLIVETLKKVII